MEDTVNKRIRALITYLQYSETRFAKEIGVRQSVINTMFKRGTEPSIKLVTSILNTFVFVSADWLLAGKGEMIKSDSTMNSVPNDNPVESPEEVVMLKTIISNQNDYIEKLKKENQELREQLSIKERQVG